MALRAFALAALLIVLSACTVDSNYGAAGFACSAAEPCPSQFACNLGVCVAGAAVPDARPGDGGPGDPDAGTIACLPAIGVSDEFAGNALDGQWTAILESGTTAVVADGVLTLTPRMNSVPTRVARVQSQPFALEGKRAFAEIPTLVDPATTAFGEFQLASQLNTHYFLRQSQGVLQFGTTIAGSELIVAALDYEAVAHRWWQMRLTEGRLYADVSADGTSWVNLDSLAADVIVGDLYLELSAGTRDSIATPGAMQVDNVNAGSGLCL